MQPPNDWERSDAVAPATAPALPSLKKDNCIRNGRYRAAFVAQESIRLYIQRFGEKNVGALTVTAADCLEVSKFQASWHSYLNAVKKKFASGMWTRERQPRSGNWHAHAAVNIGWDIKTNFPREQVAMGFYANVDPRLRELWKYLREKASSRGFGRVELLPLKFSGAACARYFSKYIAKSQASEKSLGEERCRLFGRWGGVRFVYPRFSFISARIIHKKKRWLAEELGFSDADELRKFTPHWWFHFGNVLSQVLFPEDFYKVGLAGNHRWDPIGLRAWCKDWKDMGDQSINDLILRSQVNLFYEIGFYLFRDRTQALDYAMGKVSVTEDLHATISATMRQKHLF